MYFKVQVEAKIIQTIHDCKYIEKHNCAHSDVYVAPALCWALTRGSHQDHKHTSSLASASGKISLCVSNPSHPLSQYAASSLANLSKWLHRGLFVPGRSVISFVSKSFQLYLSVCVQLTNVCCILIRCVFPILLDNSVFVSSVLCVVCSVQDHVCCRKEKARYKIATKI